MVVGVPLMVLVAIGAVWLLLGLRATGDQLTAIRTGGTLGVGLGGVVVLWLAVRRQRSNEFDLLHKYETHKLAERVADHVEAVAIENRAHQQQVAQDARDDASERRITELYTKAVEQLGSEKAPVRLGGLYALERLAQNNEGQRQTIVAVLCAYLRMPYSLPDENLSDDEDGRKENERRVQEREVRITAQTILSEHLRRGVVHSDFKGKYWEKVNLDLNHALLVNFSLDRACVSKAVFYGAVFVGRASFDDVDLLEKVDFRDAIFTDVTSFVDASFSKEISFGRARFSKEVSFGRAEFRGDARFGEAKFEGDAWFGQARFIRQANFGQVTFSKVARFDQATFDEDAWFDGVAFGRHANFYQARFARNLKFENDVLPKLGFAAATFGQKVPREIQDVRSATTPALDPNVKPVEVGPFGPGSAMPLVGGGRPQGFDVKASVTALRYATPDNPLYDRIVAEVWFRTARHAERVGFRPLS